MWRALDHLSRVLIDAGVANAILLSLIVVLVVLTRQPARRIVLARTGLCAALLMPALVVLGLVPRAHPVDWMFQMGLAPPLASSVFSPDIVASSSAPMEVERAADADDLEWPVGGRAARALTLLHAAGAMIGLAWLGLGAWGFRRLLRRSTEPQDATRRAFDELVSDSISRHRARPDLRVSDQLRGPVFGGLIRPTILIPEGFDAADANRQALRPALLHELAHANRGDAWFGWVAGLARALWFFLPHPWWLRARLRIDQEFLADRDAAGPPGESTTYARWLVGLSGPRPAPAAIAAVATAPLAPSAEADPAKTAGSWREGEFRSPLLQRVAMLLHCPFVIENHPPRWYAAIAPALLAGLAVFLSSLRILAPVDASTLRHQTSPRDLAERSFQVPQFTIVPNPRRSDDQDDGYVLPLELPPQFQLRAEIHATPSALSQIRVARYPLAAAPPENAIQAQTAEETAAWRAVTIQRDQRGTTLSIDGQPQPIAPDFGIAPQWLTITPARDQTAVLRDLVVTW